LKSKVPHALCLGAFFCDELMLAMTSPSAPVLRVMLVDDEALARLRLRSLLQACTDTATHVVAEAETAQQALDALQHQAVDLLLLDIRMPGRDGLQLATALRLLPQPPAVVFVTAHANHALRAFDLDAVDYLTKPVQRARLEAALQRVAQRRGSHRTADAESSETLKDATPTAQANVLVVMERGRVLRLPFAEVLYLKAEMKYVTLRTATRSYVLDDSLTELEQRLGDGFIRIHRNALVAAQAVRELQKGKDEGEEGWVLRVAPIDEWLPVSRRQVAAVRDALAGDVKR
jgi:two-component system, LytTR family, response regulator AlgR